MNVSAVIVTRGNVDLAPILDSLPPDWETVTWDNGRGTVTRSGDGVIARGIGDLSVYGRYAAIEHATGDVIYVQDDDCIVSDPKAIVDEYVALAPIATAHPVSVVCNQPEPWRSNPFYADHALVGFGAAFHRDAPKRAFDRWYSAEKEQGANGEWGLISRTCDIIFTALTPRVLVDIPHTSFDYASDPDRMWRQPTHQSERQRMLDLVLQVR